MSSDMVHDTNHQRRVFRILEMRVICVAITEMETELHAGRHPGRDLDHSADQCLEIADRCRKDTLEDGERSEEHTSELQSLMRISYAVFCLKKKKKEKERERETKTRAQKQKHNNKIRKT